MFQHIKTPTNTVNFTLTNIPKNARNFNQPATEMSKNIDSAVVPLNIQETRFTKAYFSHQNVKIIQDQLRHNIYLLSKGRYIIDPQPLSELRIVMESNFKQYSRNPPDHAPNEIIRNEIDRLNKAVLAYCVPQILSSANQREDYIYKITNPVIPMQPAEYVGNKKSDSRNQVSYKPWDTDSPVKPGLPALI